MTVYTIGVVRTHPRSKALGHASWGSVTQKRSVQLLVCLDDETNRYVLMPYGTQFPPGDLLELDYDQLDTLDFGLFNVMPESLRKREKCTKQIFKVEDTWLAKGATLESVPKKDESFLRGKHPRKMGRKGSSQKRR